MPGRQNLLPILALSLGLLLAAVPKPTGAQIPDEFTNLKVLPKDISKQDLVQIMRGYTDALGMRCKSCHVPGNDPNSLDGYDFPADDKENKKVARVMMQMVNEINSKLLPATGREDLVQVECFTCHHGVHEPETISNILLGTIEKSGVDSAAAEYRALRTEYYGTAAYDFSSEPLSNVAENLAQTRNDVDGAIQIAMLALEFGPDDAMNYLMLGQLYAKKGDKDTAVKNLEKALELDPGNRWAQRALDQVKGGN